MAGDGRRIRQNSLREINKCCFLLITIDTYSFYLRILKKRLYLSALIGLISLDKQFFSFYTDN